MLEKKYVEKCFTNAIVLARSSIAGEEKDHIWAELTESLGGASVDFKKIERAVRVQEWRDIAQNTRNVLVAKDFSEEFDRIFKEMVEAVLV